MTELAGRVAQGPAIYDVIRARLDAAGHLGDSSPVLPDDPAAASSGDIRWAAGARDGVLGHHAARVSQEEKAEEVAGLIAAAGRHPDRESLTAVYAAVSADGPFAYVGPMMRRLGQLNASVSDVHDLGRWLATTAPDRGAVKIGMLILGGTVLDDEDLVILRTLGAHEEFTLYASIAIRNGLPAPDRELWALAQVVDGWGRIQSVERLRHTTDPEIRSWILRTGFRNTVMHEYLAHIAATTGNLAEALQHRDPDRELLTAAGEILVALVAGGPAQGIDDYTEAPAAVEAFLGHMVARAETLGDHQAVAAVESYLAEPEGWERRIQDGWSAVLRERLLRRCAEVLSRDLWNERMSEGLRSDDGSVFWAAHQVARSRGIDTFDLLLRRLAVDPFGNWWFHAWQQVDETRARQVVDLAREVLPLAEMATGARDELGLGVGFSAHRALDWTLQALRNYPGVGGDLVGAALRSPVVRNRNMALNVLQAWPGAAWPRDGLEQVRHLAAADPVEGTRQHAQEVLDKQVS
ncbi:hypothetical protein FNH13_02755 [Ornithinimicrobium ciconiae]|uniref:Limonene hydroxylase n=1 Tax=Ornithinimicrobium ciconiae TaxID=2594265 RepID=A0A516G775_9MICO|nr:hypothetical protein [Ornithinimicrobium ciconiae]QDO87386.1 hypothetical protein FNH13_02755 [Ornithinimicrobium ciconiae]